MTCLSCHISKYVVRTKVTKIHGLYTTRDLMFPLVLSTPNPESLHSSERFSVSIHSSPRPYTGRGRLRLAGGQYVFIIRPTLGTRKKWSQRCTSMVVIQYTPYERKSCVKESPVDPCLGWVFLKYEIVFSARTCLNQSVHGSV